MALVISDEFLSAFELTSSEFLQEIALHLFQSGRLTLGYAAKKTLPILCSNLIC